MHCACCCVGSSNSLLLFHFRGQAGGAERGSGNEVVLVIICSSICQGAFLSLLHNFKSFISVYCFFFSYFWNKCLSFAVLAQLYCNKFTSWICLEHCDFFFFCFTHTHCILLLALKHWFIFSSQGVDSTGGVYRATYSAFRCSGVSGTLGAHEKMLVGVYDHLDCPQFLNNNQKEFLIIKLFCWKELQQCLHYHFWFALNGSKFFMIIL